MGKSPSDTRRRRTKSKRAMKQAIYVLFLTAASTGAPSLGLKRNMPIGHAENTLAENQKQTSMKIQNKVTPWIQHLEKILKLSIERQHNETSQLYKYIDDSIAHATSEVVKRITDLKENTDESLKALEENMKENLNSLKTITDDNNEKIIETTVNSNKSALALSLDWMSKRMDATEDILTSRVGVCGVSPDRREPGVVGYDRILHHTEGDKRIRLAGKDLSVSDVFDKTRGFFRVPKGGSGEYSISVGMVQRVFDWQFAFGEPQNVLSQYVIYVGDNPLNEALLASDNGANSNADLVQASRSIVIHLKEGDTVKLVKEDTRDQHAPHASSDLFLTFCVSMKHLDAALNLDSATVARPTAPSIDLESWSFKEPTLSTIAPPAEIETISPPSRLPMLSADTTPTPSSTKPPCIAGALKNC